MPKGNNKLFWKNVKIDDLLGCWLWTGAKINSGYGTVKIDGKRYLVHRYSWELAKGEIPDEMYICHTCDVKLCVQPDHLFLGNQKDNMSDASAKGRLPKGEQHYISKLTPAILLECGKLVKQGVTYRELAQKYGASPSAINNALLGRSWKHLEFKGYTKARKHAKLTEDEVRRIRKIRKTGLSYKKIGNIFGVNHGTIFHIIKRNTWKEVI